MRKMKITVLARAAAACHTQDFPWVHISITDPLSDIPHPQSACPCKSDSLYLKFSDVTPEDFERNPAFRKFEPFLFGAEHASQIIAFLEKHKNAAVDVVVNCEAGVSRSAAVANFILEYFNLEQARFSPPNYQPNPFVFKMLRDIASRHR